MTNRTNTISPIEREKLIDIVKGMSREELRIVVENIPLEMLVDRVMAEWVDDK